MVDYAKSSIYYALLSLTNYLPFRGEHRIDFFIECEDDNIRPARWTILLGDNNTGKTRLLRAIASTLKVVQSDNEYLNNKHKEWVSEIIDSTRDELGIKVITDRLKDKLKKRVSEKVINLSRATASLIIREEILDSINQGTYQAENTVRAAIEALESSTKHITSDGCSYAILSPSNYVPLVIGYGINRRLSKTNLTGERVTSDTESLFSDEVELLNIESWLLQLDYAHKNNSLQAKEILIKVKAILTGGILPHVKDFRIISKITASSAINYLEFLTDYGWSQVKDLGYGYQSSIGWLLDLIKRMFDHYPENENPLLMPAIVLVDEIDLHLHPDWQRKILRFLSSTFPNVQFIVSAHSPLIVQSADDANIVILKKDGDGVKVSQPKIPSFKGWSVEEILSELMGLGEKTYSDDYIKLIKEFDDALDDDNYRSALEAYDKLDLILHPESNQRKLLRIQMASLNHMPSDD